MAGEAIANAKKNQEINITPERKVSASIDHGLQYSGRTRPVIARLVILQSEGAEIGFLHRSEAQRGTSNSWD